MSANIVTLEQDIVVTRLTNPVYLVGEDGSLRLLAEGDVVTRGARLTSPTGAMVDADGRQIPVPMADMAPDEQGELLTLNDPTTGAQDDIAALQKAILDGIDPTQAFEASAAGGAPAVGGGVVGGSGNGGFIVVDRSGGATLAQGGFDTAQPVTTAERRELLDGRDDESLPDVTAPLISISAPDNSRDSTPTITGTTNAAPGSTVTLVVTDANGNQQSLMATVQPDGSFSVAVATPLADGGYGVTASVTDPAGNTGSAADDGSVDTTASITVSLDDVNADNVADAPISGTSDVGPGRTVTLVISDGNGDKVTVTAVTDADGNYKTSADLSGLADGNLTVVASVTDAAGNPASATDDTTLLDTTAPEARITLDADITADDIINAAEAGQQIPVSGTVGGDVKAGDTVTLTVNGKTFTGLVLADKTFSINVPGADLVADSSKTIDAKVITTDAAGNSATATDNEGYSVDTQGPSVVVDIVATDLKADETSVVTFTFSEPVQDFELADLTVVGGTVTGLTTSDDGNTWSATFTPTPDFEGTASVTVKDNSYTDLAGNLGRGYSDSVAADTQATGAPTVVITEDVNNDGTIDRSEISGPVNVAVTLPGEAQAGDTLKV
ncbi:retention module-containing protein, partial [Aeromonas crassostreae]